MTRDEAMRAAITEAMRVYANDWLREYGGSIEQAIAQARFAVSGLTPHGSNQSLDCKLSYEIERIQQETTARICAGGTFWIRSGRTNRWHRVATPTRAICGRAINNGDRAWALVDVKPDESLCLDC